MRIILLSKILDVAACKQTCSVDYRGFLCGQKVSEVELCIRDVELEKSEVYLLLLKDVKIRDAKLTGLVEKCKPLNRATL